MLMFSACFHLDVTAVMLMLVCLLECINVASAKQALVFCENFVILKYFYLLII